MRGIESHGALHRPPYHAATSIMTGFLHNNDVFDACPVMTHQTGATQGSLPRGLPSSAPGSPSRPSRGARGEEVNLLARQNQQKKTPLSA